MIDTIELPRRDAEYLRTIDLQHEEHENMLAWFGRHKKATAVAVIALAAGGLAVSPQARAWALSVLGALGQRAWAIARPWLASLGTFLYGLLPHSTQLTLDGLLAALHLGGKGMSFATKTGEGLAGAAETIVKGGEKGARVGASFFQGMVDGGKAILGMPRTPTLSFAESAAAIAGGGAKGAAGTGVPPETTRDVLEIMREYLRSSIPDVLRSWEK